MPSATHVSGLTFGLTNSTPQTFHIQLRREYGNPQSSVVTLGPWQSISLVLASGSLYQYCIKHEYQVVDISVKLWGDYSWDISRVNEEAYQPHPQPSQSALDGVRIDRRWQDPHPFLGDEVQRSSHSWRGM